MTDLTTSMKAGATATTGASVHLAVTITMRTSTEVPLVEESVPERRGGWTLRP
jgi:hypothetical protein